MKTYYGVDLEKQRLRLISSSKAEFIINDIIEKADLCLSKEYLHLKMSEYMLYEETGNRSIYERPYFERRNDCAYVAFSYWLTKDEKYIKQLIDLIFMICDEYTWCLPAHTKL